MKNTSKIILGLLGHLFACSALAAPTILFDIDHENWAWGHVHNGCFADESGAIYKFRIDQLQAQPIALYKQLSPKELAVLVEKIDAVTASGSYVPSKDHAYDAGLTQWSVLNSSGKRVILQEAGDRVGKHNGADAAFLITELDHLCGAE